MIDSSKAMYILDIKSTEKSIKYLKNNKLKWNNFENFSMSLSKNPEVNYGHTNHSGLLHGSNINKEEEQE